jgi:hypothetical protein
MTTEFKPFVALLLCFEDSTHLEPVIVQAPPNEQGLVRISVAIPGNHGQGNGDEPSHFWPAEKFVVFSADLMDRVNTLSHRATDSNAAAVKILQTEAEFVFSETLEDAAIASALSQFEPKHTH